MATNLLQLGNYVQQGFDDGRQQGLERRYNRLAGEAFNAPDTATRDAAVGQIAVNNPAAATALRGQFQEQDDRNTRLLTNMARYMKGALDSKNDQAIAGAWKAIRPALIKSRLATEQEISPNWDPSYEQTVHQLLAMGDPNASGSVLQSQKIGADGYIYNSFRDGRMVNTGVKADRQAWFRDQPGIPAGIVDKSGAFTPLGEYGGAPYGSTYEDGQPVATTTAVDASGVPVSIGNDIPADARAAILAGNANGVQSNGFMPINRVANVGVGGAATRPSAAQDAAATERAKLQAQQDFLPTELGMRTDAAIRQAEGTQMAKDRAERAAQAPKRIKQYEQSLAASKSVRDALDRAIDLTGPTTTGWAGARMRNIEGSDAFDLASQIETVKANLGFDRLQQMRDNSPTGGALGAIAVQELVALQSTIANLDPNQSAGQLKANLQKVQQHYKNWEAAVQQALADEKRSGGGAAPAAGQRTIVRTGTSNGRKVIQYSDGTIEYGN